MKAMRITVVKLIVLLAALSAYSQVSPEQQRISSTPPSVAGPGTSNTSSAGAILATNQSGQFISASEMTTQLASLRTAVEQTLPVLSAFNSGFATSQSGTLSSQELSTGISNLLASALGRGSNHNAAAGSGKWSSGLTNFASVVNGLIKTNASTNNADAVSIDPSTLGQLQTLQANLNAVEAILQNLRIGSNAIGSGETGPSAASQPGTPPASPLPTGR